MGTFLPSPDDYRDYFEFVRRRGLAIAFDDGLSATEVEEAEQRFEVRFPPDLRALLEFGLPVSPKGFPNWRSASAKELATWLELPLDGICFDIEHNDFWLDEWGDRPKHLEQAFAVARQRVDEAPKLIPVFGHRFMPTEPAEAGNPVFSVHQTDVIYYGFDLPGYLAEEFRVPPPEWARSEPRSIEFWDKLIE